MSGGAISQTPKVYGWCPGALRPMMSGDGLLVRVRPRLGRLTRTQVEALCDAALAHGNGIIDLTSRANVQVRGVQPASYDALLAELSAAALIDETVADETRAFKLKFFKWSKRFAYNCFHTVSSCFVRRARY